MSKDRIDPTLLLPEEEMSYEFRTKKKKKKKKKKKYEDPLKDCIDLEERPPIVIEYDCTVETNSVTLDPDVTIKVEEMDLDLLAIAEDDSINDQNDNEEPYQEPIVSLKAGDTQGDAAVILTFQKNLKKDHTGVKIEQHDIKIELEVDENVTIEMEQDNDDEDVKIEIPEAFDNCSSDKPPENNGLSCEKCHMVFKTRNTLKIHKVRKHGIRNKSFKYKCKICGFDYEYKTSLDTHIKRKHMGNVNPEDSEDKTCSLCFLVFKGINRLRMHMHRKHGTKMENFKHKCSKCKLSYALYSSYVTHVKRKHSQRYKKKPEVTFSCRLCPKVFFNRDTYVRHLQRTHETDKSGDIKLATWQKTKSTYQCKLCPLLFARPSHLKLHMRRNHSSYQDQYSIKCPYCNMSYDKNESLQRHLLRKHTNSLFCDVCHNGFKNQEEFDNHKHKKPVLECTLCNEIFASKGSLAKHMRLAHKLETADKNFNCHLCNESFHEKRQLNTHMVKDHLKLKFPCQFCNKVLKTRDSFQNHYQKMHASCLQNTADYICEQCKLPFTSEKELCSHTYEKHRVPIPKTIKEELKTKHDSEDQAQLKDETGNDNHVDNKNQNHADDNDPENHKIADKSIVDDEEDIPNTDVRFEIKTESIGNETVKTKLKKDAFKKEVKQKRRVLYDCIKCTEQFSSFPLLRQHHDEMHKLMEETQCQSCGEILLLKDLDKHTKAKHAVLTILKCELCDFETTSKTTLSQHTLRHKNTSSIPCTYEGCRYKSFYQEAMEKHLKRHSELGAKLQCSHCPFQTMNKYILRYHEEEHETGNKKYKCDQCSYATTMPANLVQHKFKHSSEKRFKCESCPFATKYNTSLRFHVRKKHCDLPPKVE